MFKAAKLLRALKAIKLVGIVRKLIAILSFFTLMLCYQNCHNFSVLQLETSDLSSSSSPSYADLKKLIFAPNCISCHGPVNPSGNIDLSSYQKLMRANIVVPFEVDRSVLYSSIANNSMPPNSAGLTEFQKTLIKNWINNGAYETNPDPRSCVEPAPVLPRLSHFEYFNILNDLLNGTFDQSILRDLPELPPLYGFDNLSEATLDKIAVEGYIKTSDQVVEKILASPDILSQCSTQLSSTMKNWSNCADPVIEYVGQRLFRRPLRTVEVQKFKMLFDKVFNDGLARIRASTVPVQGSVDGFAMTANGGRINGWAYDSDWPERNVEVKFYAKNSGTQNPDIYVGSALANQPSPDIYSNLGIQGNRRFQFKVPQIYLNGSAFTFTVKAFAMSSDPLLAGSNPFDISAVTAIPDPIQDSDLDSVFKDALSATLTAQLLSPNFLYKMEYFPEGFLPSEINYQLAARVSLLIGSTYPDAELSTLATNQGLTTDVLKTQIERLMNKYKTRFSTSFAGQWLGFRSKLSSDTNSLDFAMATESKLVFEKVLSDGVPTTTLLNPGYSFVNNLLATHYGLPNSANGTEFSKVPTDIRGGLLSQGQWLKRTATLSDSHPIKRGIWVLDSVLCRSLPPLSAATFEEIAAAQSHINPNASIVDRMAAHRQTSSRCMTCHEQIDPIGLALESWDKEGKFRNSYANGRPIIANLPFNGNVVTSPYELSNAIADTNEFTTCVEKKLYAYIAGKDPTKPRSCYPRVTNEKSLRDLAAEIIGTSVNKERQ